MISKSIFITEQSELELKFNDAISDGFVPTLAIVFTSIHQNRTEISNFLSKNAIQIFGCTTAGEIIDDEVMEGSAVIMLLDTKIEYFRIFYEENTDTYKASNDLAKLAKAEFNNPSILIVSSGLTIDAEEIIKGMMDVDTSIPLFGGLAGDDLTMKSSFVFSNNFETNCGLLALVLDSDKINVQGLATSGWDNIGIEKTITKSKGNIVYEMDGEPAVDVFVKFFQFTESVDNRAEIIAMNFAQYPLQMKKDNGNVVLRAPMMVDIDSRALIFAGGIPEGSKVKFSVPPGFDLIEKTAERISKLKDKIPEADAIVMFSCKGRHLALGPMTGDEAEKIRAIWNTPMVGLFTYGEIGTAKDSTCDFHNETCSMVIIAEK